MLSINYRYLLFAIRMKYFSFDFIQNKFFNLWKKIKNKKSHFFLNHFEINVIRPAIN